MTLRRAGRQSASASPVVARGARLPQVIEPMLPTAAAEPFDSPAHIFEVLWDGVRALAFVEAVALRLQDRWGRDVSHRYPELSHIANRVRASGMVIDGEIVALTRRRPDFQRCRHGSC